MTPSKITNAQPLYAGNAAKMRGEGPGVAPGGSSAAGLNPVYPGFLGPDQTLFLKAQIVFWLLGATDGHAKNFSIFLLPGGRFRLTPLYDFMSAQPNVDAGEIRHNAMKLAMAVGDNRHYVIDSIMPRHFLQTAASCSVPASLVQTILDEIENDTDRAIDAAVNGLPPGFPERIVSSVIEGLRRRLRLFAHAAAST
jgi:serine/threonine-protein kinase HipA